MYNDKIMARFQNPANVGEMDDADAVGEVGNIKCGDIMRIYLKIKDDVIMDVKFKTYGCVAAIASTDVMCDIIKGKSIDDALKVTGKDIVKEMGGEVPPIKMHCSVLAHEALKDAIEKYYSK